MPIKSLKSAGAKALGQGLGAGAEPTDPEFNQTVLLLHADGSEGEGDNDKLGTPSYKAFQDSSTSAHDILVNGDTRGNDFSPYYYADGYWSFLFNHNNNDKVVVGNTQTLCGFGYEDFQIDCMIYSIRPSSDSQGFFGTQATNTSSTGWRLQYDGSNIDWNHGTSNIHTFAFTFTPNTWFHFVIQRVSGTFKIFIDGVEKISASDTTNYGATTNLTLGNGGNAGAGEMSGYLSNLKVITGASSTTSKITTPFTDPSVQGEMSVEFDGNGDYLKVNSDIGTLTGDFTIECFFYQNTTGAYRTIFSSTTTYTTSNQIRVSTGNSNDTLRVASGGSDLFDASSSFNNNEWNHVALVRSGTTLTLYLNGTSVGSATNSTSFVASEFQIGDTQLSSTHYYFDGYISNVRVTNGTALYTGTFTPSSSPFTTTSQGATASEVKLLTCQSKSFVDESSSSHGITANGNTRITEFSPFNDGYWSVEFANSNELLSLPYSSNQQIGTGQFTLELFVKFSTVGSNTSQGLIGNYTGWYFQYIGGDLELALGASAVIERAWSPVANRWYHIACSRDSSNNIRIFVDGTQLGSVQNSTANLSHGSNALQIGNIGPQYARYFAGGKISNLRLVVGSALYTSNFTKPSSPLTTTSQGATASEVEVLMCQSNRFIENSSNNFTVGLAYTPTISEDIPFELLSRQTKLITCQGNRFKDIIPNRYEFTASGSPKVSTNTPFTVTKTANVGSGFFDGTNDNAQIPESTDTRLSSNDFTFECWFYGTSNSSANKTLFSQGASGAYSPLSIYYYGNGIRWNASSTGSSYDVINDTTTYGTNGYPNQWNHVVACREGSNFALFLNGTRVNTVTSSATLMTPSQNTSMGSRPTNDLDYDGYISDWRLVIGSTIYDPTSTTITPPTTSLTAVTNTKLLTCQYSGTVRNVGFADESHYRQRINKIGTVGMGTFSPNSLEDGYWSVYFNGNYLNIPDSADFTFGSNNFSIAVWVYRTDSSASTERGIANTGGSSYTSWLFTTKKFWASTTSNSWNIKINYSQDVPINQWVYVQVNRVGNVYTAYHNGVSVGTVTVSGSLFNNNDVFQLGFRQGASSMVGYMSNFIMTNGGNLASTNVPTAPFTADSNTKLLCLQSNRYIDNSNSGHTITPNNSASTFVKPFSPFAPTRPYSKDAVGGSAYFGGSGNKLQIIANNSTDFQLDDTTEWCVEFWVYMQNPLSSYSRVMQINNQHGWAIRFDGGKIGLGRSDDGSSEIIEDSTTLPASQWTHFAFTNKNQSGIYYLRLFRNGVQVVTKSNWSQSWANDNHTSSGGYLMIASYYTNNFAGIMHLSSMRLIQGSSHYSASFTPPSVPLPSTDKTKLLMNFTNAGIIDHTMRNNISTEGDVKISTIQKKVGTGSMYFDGTGDYIQLPFNSNLNFGTGSFTWEAWVHPTDISGVDGIYGTSGGTGSQPKFVIHLNAGTPSVHYNGVGSSNSYTTATSAISANTWTHLAYVRNGSTWTWYINGVASGTGSETGAYLHFTTQPTYVGYGGESYFTPFNGYIDEMRVTKGVARYTSNFTAPTKAFANK